MIEVNASPGPMHEVLTVVPTDSDHQHKVDHLPDDVDRYYSGAIKVLNAGVPDAAAVQLRKTLEAAAAHYNVQEKVLVKSIEKLIDQGHVTKSFGPALTNIRRVGNVGAHHTDQVLDDETVRTGTSLHLRAAEEPLRSAG